MTLSDKSDEDLMQQYNGGDGAAFEVLYARHKGGLYRYILRQCHQEKELANELFQDVWMKLINARQSFSARQSGDVSQVSFKAYLYRIAYNHLVDHWRKAGGLSELYNDEQMAGNETPLEHVQKQQTQKQLYKAIAELADEQRQALLLKEEGGLSLLEIAEITGVNRETVKSRLRYAMNRLRRVLQPLRSVS